MQYLLVARFRSSRYVERIQREQRTYAPTASRRIKKTHRFVASRSIMWPFLFQWRVGSGWPRGGPHSSKAVSPAATLVFCGSARNSSRSTATDKNMSMIHQCITKILRRLCKKRKGGRMTILFRARLTRKYLGHLENFFLILKARRK